MKTALLLLIKHFRDLLGFGLLLGFVILIGMIVGDGILDDYFPFIREFYVFINEDSAPILLKWLTGVIIMIAIYVSVLFLWFLPSHIIGYFIGYKKVTDFLNLEPSSFSDFIRNDLSQSEAAALLDIGSGKFIIANIISFFYCPVLILFVMSTFGLIDLSNFGMGPPTLLYSLFIIFICIYFIWPIVFIYRNRIKVISLKQINNNIYCPYNEISLELINIFRSSKEKSEEAFNRTGDIYYLPEILFKDTGAVLDKFRNADKLSTWTICKMRVKERRYLKHIFSDKDILLEFSDKSCLIWDLVPGKFKNDYDFIKKIVNKGGGYFSCLNKIFREDKIILEEALKNLKESGVKGELIKSASRSIRSDREFIIEMIRKYQDKSGFEQAFLGIFNFPRKTGISRKLRNDKELAIEMVKIDGRHFLRFSKNLKEDKDIILEAYKKEYFLLNYASKKLTHDKEFIIKLIHSIGPDDDLYYVMNQLNSKWKGAFEEVILKHPDLKNIL